FADGETISFSGTSRSGGAISGSYKIDMASETPDTMQDLLSAIEDAFSSEVNATVDTSGRIVVTDKYTGASQLSITSISHTGTDPQGEFFGTVLTTNTDGQEGRYAMAITATDDGSNHLVLRSDDYGSTSFTISQVSDPSGTNKEVVIGSEANTTIAGPEIVAGTAWGDIDTTDGAANDITNGAVISYTGTDHSGNSVSDSYTINNKAVDTVQGLLTDIEGAFGLSAGSVTVDANGKINIT
ncbi:unnamed protein product, partial [marine sediment metagenome]